MLVENLVPIIPSELILPLAGFQAARGQFSPLMATLAATIGSSLGGAAWYGLGRVFGLERLKALADNHGRWLPFTSNEISRADRWFQSWGRFAICVGRTIPGVRGVICIPAGIAAMPVTRFWLWSSIGALLWSSALVMTGYALNAHYSAVQRWLNPIADGFLIVCGLLYLLRVIRYRPGPS